MDDLLRETESERNSKVNIQDSRLVNGTNNIHTCNQTRQSGEKGCEPDYTSIMGLAKTGRTWNCKRCGSTWEESKK